MTAKPEVTGFFEARTSSIQYVVADPETKKCAIVDPVLDYDEKAGATNTIEADKILSDARAVSDAGAFLIVVEGVLEDIATRVAQDVSAPIIGIGASAQCDGQVLVTEDMLGLFERTPRFVKRYADLASEIGAAAAKYRQEVIDRGFPTADQTYRPKN